MCKAESHQAAHQEEALSAHRPPSAWAGGGAGGASFEARLQVLRLRFVCVCARGCVRAGAGAGAVAGIYI